jgi:hypothetical protein
MKTYQDQLQIVTPFMKWRNIAAAQFLMENTDYTPKL